MFYQLPPPTRYDLQFTLLGFPVRVHPLFWVLTLLLGSSSGSLLQILIWVAIVFISILVHELGHSVAMRMYGQPSSILLHIGGGMAIPQSVQFGHQTATVYFTPTQQVIVSLAGPFAGFALAMLTLAIAAMLGGQISISLLLGFIPIPSAMLPNSGLILNIIIAILLWVNVFWGLINLLPVYPLDGGQVTRALMLKSDPWNGIRTSLWISVITGGLMAILSLTLLGSTYMALLFGMLTFQSYQSLQGRFG